MKTVAARWPSQLQLHAAACAWLGQLYRQPPLRILVVAHSKMRKLGATFVEEKRATKEAWAMRAKWGRASGMEREVCATEEMAEYLSPTASAVDRASGSRCKVSFFKKNDH